MSGAFFNWSTGKDSALALHAHRQQGGSGIKSLLTSLSTEHRRVSQHGVRLELLERQAAALGLPLDPVWLPSDPGMAEYEQAMGAAVARQQACGRTEAVFGDHFPRGSPRLP